MEPFRRLFLHPCPYPVNKLHDFFRPPDGCSRAKLYRLGEATCFAAFPPGAFADGDELQDLRESEEAHFGYVRHSSHNYTS